MAITLAAHWDSHNFPRMPQSKSKQSLRLNRKRECFNPRWASQEHRSGEPGGVSPRSISFVEDPRADAARLTSNDSRTTSVLSLVHLRAEESSVRALSGFLIPVHESSPGSHRPVRRDS